MADLFDQDHPQSIEGERFEFDLFKDLDACYALLIEAKDQIYEAISEVKHWEDRSAETLLPLARDIETLERARVIIKELVDPRESDAVRQ